MTLRQEYARPPAPSPGTGTSRAAAPAHTGPGRDQPHRVSRPRPATAAEPSQPTARCAHRRAQSRDPAPSRGPATGRTLAAWPRKPRQPRHSRRTGPAAGSCRSSPHPAPPVPITGGLPRGLRGWVLSNELLPQVAGAGPVPVGVLWVSCRPLRVAGPLAAGDGGTSRDGSPAGTATPNPATPPRRPQCTRPSTHTIAKTPPGGRNGRRSHDGPSPRPG
jgi:hypothetical protein